jgi:glycosyltransferase involved in cell wall biosynthesis
MKICLLGGLSGQLDEGMNNVAYHLRRELSRRHQVSSLDPRDYRSLRFWKRIRSLQPDVIHYTSGPSIVSLALIRLLGLFCQDSQTVVSALHPWFPWHTELLIRTVRPSLILTQSRATDTLFRRHGCRTVFLPNGVDVSKFKPVSEGDKQALRSDFGVPGDKYVILHVGAVKQRRGVGILSELQGGDQQVIVAGSLSTGHDRVTLQALELRGCWVWTDYFDDIERLYGLADCYVFPTQNPLHAIEIPLSVLEAMACNLPVVSSAFGGLPDILDAGEGLVYAHSPEESLQGVQSIRRKETFIHTRKKVVAMDWANIAKQLESAYRTVM